MGDLSLLWVKTSEIGYGRVGEQLARGLRRRGVTVYDSPDVPTNLICTVSFPTHTMGAWQGQHQSVFTMWETNRLPEAFRETFHEFDTIVVPSVQNVELFSEFHNNVQLCLLGVDPELWHYEPAPEVGAFFDFLFSGRGERKGIDVAYKAFRTVFSHDPAPGKPVPRLILKSRLGIGEYFSGNVIPMIGVLDALDEVNLYRQAHCYLQPARGEGFGLQPLQALAMGRPTILTGAHGHASFADLGIPIGSTLVNSGEFMFAGREDTLGNQAGEWWEPDFEEVCEAMWDVYNNYDGHVERAKKAAAVVAERFTWDNMVDRFTELLGGEMDKPYSGSGEWVAHERQLFHIVTNKDHTIQAAGITRHYVAGRDYYDVSDVKRSLFDAGVLSPLCLQGDSDLGLHPRQVAHLDQYNAAKSSCPTCGQVLGSMPMAADLIEKAWAK